MGIDSITCYCRANKSASLTAKSEAHIATDLDKKKPFLEPTTIYYTHSRLRHIIRFLFQSEFLPIQYFLDDIISPNTSFRLCDISFAFSITIGLSVNSIFFFRRTTIYPHYFCSPLFAKANLDPKFSVKIACIHSVTISPSRHRRKITYKA